MRKLLLALLVCSTSFAQIGIGTTTPQETLDVNGSTRVRNLDTTNPNNNGVASNVKVDLNGTLILEDNSAANTVIVDDSNILSTPVILQTNSAGDTIQSVVHTSTFTTAYPRLVFIKSTISLSLEKDSSGPITNGQARISGSSLSINGNVTDRDRATYSNHDDSERVMTGYMYLKNDTHIFLPAGTHSIEIEVFIAGGGETRAEFGGNNVDVLQVVQF